jgi:hypothetical protein
MPGSDKCSTWLQRWSDREEFELASGQRIEAHVIFIGRALRSPNICLGILPPKYADDQHPIGLDAKIDSMYPANRSSISGADVFDRWL